MLLLFVRVRRGAGVRGGHCKLRGRPQHNDILASVVFVVLRTQRKLVAHMLSQIKGT
jgi:hypothetical protein